MMRKVALLTGGTLAVPQKMLTDGRLVDVVGEVAAIPGGANTCHKVSNCPSGLPTDFRSSPVSRNPVCRSWTGLFEHGMGSTSEGEFLAQLCALIRFGFTVRQGQCLSSRLFRFFPVPHCLSHKTGAIQVAVFASVKRHAGNLRLFWSCVGILVGAICRFQKGFCLVRSLTTWTFRLTKYTNELAAVGGDAKVEVVYDDVLWRGDWD